ncbi:hypothetical protein [Desulforapulum autotrophicum]|uniref:hypothetical protein n=1 Tax=Desulforapulum autotrophicum TaxID=2296 RepID=UPI001E527031|nr:hypothetical protein [Desulforapulum autotrophicum]
MAALVVKFTESSARMPEEMLLNGFSRLDVQIKSAIVISPMNSFNPNNQTM